MGHGLAVFDLDRTLIEGSSLVHLGRELVRRGTIPPSLVARYGLTHLVFRQRGLSQARTERIVRSLLGAVAGMEAAPLAAAARDVGAVVAEQAHPTARWLVDRHLAAGDLCVIVSASPHELVEAAAAALGIHRAIGTRLEAVDGRCTGRLDGPFCYGAAKLAALKRELGPVDLANATAYADSGSDRPLLEGCGSPVAVNPDGELRRAALAEAWPIVRF